MQKIFKNIQLDKIGYELKKYESAHYFFRHSTLKIILNKILII